MLPGAKVGTDFPVQLLIISEPDGERRLRVRLGVERPGERCVIPGVDQFPATAPGNRDESISGGGGAAVHGDGFCRTRLAISGRDGPPDAGRVVWRDCAAVGQKRARVVEKDDAVAQQAPPLLGVEGDGVGRVTVRAVSWRARGPVRTHGEPLDQELRTYVDCGPLLARSRGVLVTAPAKTVRAGPWPAPAGAWLAAAWPGPRWRGPAAPRRQAS